MNHLKREDLYSLEKYAVIKNDFRKQVIEHKKDRQIAIGEHATLYFEDKLTMQYQVQEMLRLERMFEPELIQDELDVYNPLIPDGHNWKATFMIEYPDVEERKVMLSKLVGIEDTTWVRIGNFNKVFAISNEDLDRSEPNKTSAVHFMRFELTPEMIAAVKKGEKIAMGTNIPAYTMSVELTPAQHKSLAADLA